MKAAPSVKTRAVRVRRVASPKERSEPSSFPGFIFSNSLAWTRLLLGLYVHFLSVATVKKHTIHIFEKLGVESRTAATLRAVGALG